MTSSTLKRFWRIGWMAALSCGIAAGALAGVALIYDNEGAVKTGHSTPADVNDAGASVPADAALANANTLLWGDGEGLFRAAIARLDTDLNLALLRRGERVGNDELQAAHAARWSRTAAFLQIATSPASGVGGAPAVVTIAPMPDSAPFSVRIDGQEPGSAPVVLKERFNKAKFKLEVVNVSTTPVWALNVQLTSNPTLSFWREGRHQGLNDVPAKVFEYSQQAVFRPIRPGDKISVQVEVYFIKERDYVWTFQISSKELQGERRALVRFE
jgi:hypothetical protein